MSILALHVNNCVFFFSLDGPLSHDRYLSFFSVIKEAFDPQNDGKGEVGKVSSLLDTSVCFLMCNVIVIVHGIYFSRLGSFWQ